MQVCTSLQTDNHASNPPLGFFYRPDVLPAAQPTASKHRNQLPQVRAGEEGHARPGWTTARVKTWTGLPVEESARMTEDRGKWRKYVHGVANPRIENGKRTEQNGLRHSATWLLPALGSCFHVDTDAVGGVAQW